MFCASSNTLPREPEGCDPLGHLLAPAQEHGGMADLPDDLLGLKAFPGPALPPSEKGRILHYHWTIFRGQVIIYLP